jgi:8-oxo-dGTP diphosphatase
MVKEVFGMKEFVDQNGNKVYLTFLANEFHEEAEHVLVICQYGDGWLLTNHKKRGLEFPGGKQEVGETLIEAARREVLEETGAILGEIYRIGEYKVTDQKGSFVKAVFWGMITRIERTNSYFETNGPVLVKGDILKKRFGEEYSFIMKDQVIVECMNQIKKLQGEKKGEEGKRHNY